MRMNGETVGLRERFSNGAEWPGDTRHLPASEVANRHCEIQLTVPDHRDSGALNSKNDPLGKLRNGHAERYYEEVRNRDRSIEIESVSSHSGFSVDDVEAVFRHVFFEDHDLADDRHRFAPDYEMAQSWQRLRDGRDVKAHDLTMLHHELEESKLMAQGMPYVEAHDRVNDMGYNYQAEVAEWRGNGGE